MVYEEGEEHFEFICTSADKPYYRLVLKNFPKSLAQDFVNGGTLDVYSDDNGKWLSAFAPIKNSEGKPVAIIQVDQNFMAFIEAANTDLRKNVMLGLIVLVPFFLLLFSFINSTLKKQESDKERLHEQNEEIRIQNEFIMTSHDKLEKSKILIEEQNRSLDRQVRIRTRELLKVNLELTTFFYRSSHDVQGPLATIKGLCHMAAIEPLRQNSYIKMIDHSTDLLRERIKSISAVYEIKSQKVHREAFDLVDLLKNINKQYAHQLNSLGIAFIIAVPKAFKVYSDKSIIRIVLTELLKILYSKDRKHNVRL